MTRPPAPSDAPAAAASVARAGRPFASVLAAAVGVAILLVALMVVGIVRAWDPLPFWDMWDGYLGFWYSLAGGDVSAWWAQHNEHRIVLARVFFWFDLAFLHGAGWSLIVVNALSALAIAGAFIAALIARLRETVRGTWRSARAVMLCVVILGLATSWLQRQNLLWGFQIQFFLAVLLPLAAFILLAAAGSSARWSTARYTASVVLAVASVGTLAAGIAAPFVATAEGAALRESRRRVAMMATAAAVSAAAYLNGYVSPGQTASPIHSLAHPRTVLIYVLRFLGGPVELTTQSSLLGAVSAVILLLLITVSAYRWVRGRDRSRMATAMLAFAAYVLLWAFITALGRLNFGADQALAGRYETPVLALWAAAIVLVAPQILTARMQRARLLTAALAAVVVGLVWVQTGVFADFSGVRFARQSAALAIALGVPDSGRIHAVFPTPELPVELGAQAMRDGLTSLAQPPYPDLRRELGKPWPTERSAPCDVQVSGATAIAGSDFERLDGTLTADPALSGGDPILRVVDSTGLVVGFADVQQPGDTAPPRAMVAYVRAELAKGPLRLADSDVSCTGQMTMP